ncbi:MAG: quinolinate synthase NadA [Paludibacteraceae bacterium]|nr:quinolinate synthase NadA [Paludibacteraceae bacterium]
MKVKENWLKKGFVDEPIENNIDLKIAIKNLCKEKNAIIMAHYYQNKDVQEIADYIGDSLALAQWAKNTDADIIVVCGVNFMGETAKILSPEKTVLIPDLNAGCSLADSCKAEDLLKLKNQFPNHKVISYVNTTAEVKALTDICVTSTNAKKIISQLPKNEKIIFGPDKNLGGYINKTVGVDMKLWDGACHVHEQFQLSEILEMKKKYPNAKILTHPECKDEIIAISDVVGSTQALINYSVENDYNEFIVVTESGVIHEMKRLNPTKIFIPIQIQEDGIKKCNECKYMRLNTLEKIYNCLKYNYPIIEIEEEIRKKAEKSIIEMLKLS